MSSLVGKIPGKKKCQPTPIFLPGESHRQKSYCSKGHKESNTTEATVNTCMKYILECIFKVNLI